MRSRRYHDQEMQLELDKLQSKLRAEWLDKSLPDDWDGLETWDRIDRKKTRVTIRLDADMVRWFRKLGPGYGARINSILRIYWLALLSGHIEAHEGDNVILRIETRARDMLRELEEKYPG